MRGKSRLAPLEPHLKTYEANRAQLLATMQGKYVLVKDDCVLGPFETSHDAVDEGYRRFGVVSFLVKQVLETEPIEYIS